VNEVWLVWFFAHSERRVADENSDRAGHVTAAVPAVYRPASATVKTVSVSGKWLSPFLSILLSLKLYYGLDCLHW